MKHSRVLLLTRRILLAALVVLSSASVLQAEEMRGSFSLPYDTYWAGVLLPAGDYTFVVDSTGQKPIELRTAEGKTFRRIIAYTEDLNSPAKSQLVIAHGDQEAIVHVLYLAEVKTAYHFDLPEKYEVTSRIIAGLSAPAGIEHIPVVISGK